MLIQHGRKNGSPARQESTSPFEDWTVKVRERPALKGGKEGGQVYHGTGKMKKSGKRGKCACAFLSIRRNVRGNDLFLRLKGGERLFH